MIPKEIYVISQQLRDSANGERCTFEIAGVCNGDRATTSLCHLPSTGHGVAKKSSDLYAAYGCSKCHDVVDGRVQNEEYKNHQFFYVYRSICRTYTRYFHKGLLNIAGAHIDHDPYWH